MPRAQLLNGELISLRTAIVEPDGPNYPDAWAINGGIYNDAEINVIGATWATDDTTVQPQIQLWTRIDGENPVNADPQTLIAKVKDDALLTDVGSVSYQIDNVVDDGQDFSAAKPVGPGDPSPYIVTAEPAAGTDAPFFGWADAGGIPQALKVRTNHFGDDEDAALGWVGGVTPDGTVVAYSVRLPNIHERLLVTNLAGADVAVTVPAIAGVGDGVGYVVLDISVRFF